MNKKANVQTELLQEIYCRICWMCIWVECELNKAWTKLTEEKNWRWKCFMYGYSWVLSLFCYLQAAMIRWTLIHHWIQYTKMRNIQEYCMFFAFFRFKLITSEKKDNSWDSMDIKSFHTSIQHSIYL